MSKLNVRFAYRVCVFRPIMRQPGGVGVPWGSGSRGRLLQGRTERQQEELGLLSLPSSLVCFKAIC